jgi:FtsH-binding integral membrane protein
MKLCPECSKSPLPFLMAFFLASVSAFLTWLTLTYSQFGTVERIAGTTLVFIAVGATIVHYMLACMRRHCRHGSHASHHHKAAS